LLHLGLATLNAAGGEEFTKKEFSLSVVNAQGTRTSYKKSMTSTINKPHTIEQEA